MMLTVQDAIEFACGFQETRVAMAGGKQRVIEPRHPMYDRGMAYARLGSEASTTSLRQAWEQYSEAPW